MAEANTPIKQNESNEDAEIDSKNYQKLKISIGKVKFSQFVLKCFCYCLHS